MDRWLRPTRRHSTSRGRPGAGEFGEIATAGANVSSHTDDTAAAEYDSIATGYGASHRRAYSTYSNIDDATTPAPPLGSPTSLSATPVSSTASTSRGPTVHHETSFRIERALAIGHSERLARPGPNVTTYST